jgi:hypothetical protein
MSSQISLSIIIPDEKLSLNKEYATVFGCGSPFQNNLDDSLWSLAIYEVWEAPYIYKHLKFMIEELIYIIKKANEIVDFSTETYKNIGLKLLKIGEGLGEGLKISSGFSTIFPLFQELFEINREYNDKFKQAKIIEIYHTIYNNIVQLQVDIETSEKKDIPEFLIEKDKLIKDINMFKLLGSKEEIKSLEYLMEGVDIELFW